jgi:hypothetical protein
MTMAKIAENLVGLKVSKLVRDNEDDVLPVDADVVANLVTVLEELLGDGYVVEAIQE